MYVVEHDGHAMARSFSQANVTRNDSFEDLGAEETAEIGGDLLGKRRPVLIHREQDAFDGWLRVDGSAKAHERIEKLGDAFEGQVLALNGHQNGVTGGEGVNGEQIKRRSAINQDVVVFGKNAGHDRFQLVFPIFDRHELDRRADEIFVGWNEVETFDLGIENDTFDGLIED